MTSPCSARYFSLMERTLSKQECLEVKDHWNAKAKDESLPVAPNNSPSAS